MGSLFDKIGPGGNRPVALSLVKSGQPARRLELGKHMNDKQQPALADEDFDHIRQTNLGRLIEDVHFFFDKQAMMYLRQSDYPMIKSADAHVMRTMQMEGTRVTDMARQAGISKQAMSKLVAGFVDHGFLDWSRDPNDKRNRIVNVTEAGRKLLDCGIAALRKAENDISDIVGVEGLEQFRQLLLSIKLAKNIRPSPSHPRDRKRRV